MGIIGGSSVDIFNLMPLKRLASIYSTSKMSDPITFVKTIKPVIYRKGMTLGEYLEARILGMTQTEVSVPQENIVAVAEDEEDPDILLVTTEDDQVFEYYLTDPDDEDYKAIQEEQEWLLSFAVSHDYA